MQPFRIAIIAALALTLAACSSADDTGSGDPNGGTAPSPTVSQPPAAGGATLTIRVENFAFEPAAATIAANGTITWTNADRVLHVVQSGTPDATTQAFRGGLGTAGAEFTHAFSDAGTFDYHCSVHPGMRGTITVTA